MGLYSLVLWTHWVTGIHGIGLEHTACGALALLFSPGSPCGVPTVRSSWYSVLGHLRRALSARGSPCGAPTSQCSWCSVLGHPCGADALALPISGCLAAPQPRNAVGALFLAPTRTSGVTAPCASYRPVWRARSAELPIARDMSDKSGKVVQRLLSIKLKAEGALQALQPGARACSP